MPKLVSLLNFYEEEPSWLAAHIASLKGTADHLIAVDGAYFLYPDGRAASSAIQHRTIHETAKAIGIGLTLHIPQTVWYGNEVEKRSFMFALAETLTTEDDWYLVLDADEIMRKSPFDLKRRLGDTDKLVGDVTCIDRQKRTDAAQEFDWPPECRYPARRFFKAKRGLRVENQHFHYTVDGQDLWGGETEEGLAPTEDFLDLEFEHRQAERDRHRNIQREAYYKLRDELGVERGLHERPSSSSERLSLSK